MPIACRPVQSSPSPSTWLVDRQWAQLLNLQENVNNTDTFSLFSNNCAWGAFPRSSATRQRCPENHTNPGGRARRNGSDKRNWKTQTHRQKKNGFTFGSRSITLSISPSGRQQMSGVLVKTGRRGRSAQGTGCSARGRRKRGRSRTVRRCLPQRSPRVHFLACRRRRRR